MQEIGNIISQEQANTNNLFAQEQSKTLRCMLLNYKVCLAFCAMFTVFLVFAYNMFTHFTPTASELQMSGVFNLTRALTDYLFVNGGRALRTGRELFAADSNNEVANTETTKLVVPPPQY